MSEKQINKLKLASFSVLGLALCCMLVFFASHNRQPNLQERALSRASIHAERLIEKKFMVEGIKVPQVLSRGLASESYTNQALEGPIGFDPWGTPFKYLVQKNSKSPQKGLVILWSAGPDKMFQTTRDYIASGRRYEGDDFGQAYPFNFSTKN